MQRATYFQLVELQSSGDQKGRSCTGGLTLRRGYTGSSLTMNTKKSNERHVAGRAGNALRKSCRTTWSPMSCEREGPTFSMQKEKHRSF